MRTIEVGVTITDAAVDDERTTIFCTPVSGDPRCPDCGHDGTYRDTVVRPLTDLPVAGYPLMLRVAVPRYRCTTAECGRAVFNQNLGKLATPRSSTTRRCARYVLRRLMIDLATISVIAGELGLSRHTVSTIAMRTVADLIAAAGPGRLDGVRVIGVEEHRWAPRRVGTEGFVMLIIDPHPRPRRHRARAAARPGGRALSGGTEDVASRATVGVSRAGRSDRHGRLRRLQDRSR
ncbi:transposase family protein [Mycolicibacterium goodii]|uniref:transposase family protein n=1 Tax=Mycolicibacterium goodii TaxID=134601 RepID=UPI00296F2932